MIILLMIVTLATGIAVGMYISSQISKSIACRTGEDSYENRNKKMVRKIWSFTYVDIEGNKIDVPIQNHSFELTDKLYDENDKELKKCKDYESDDIQYEDGVPLSPCCGYKIQEGTDLCGNPECLEHTGIDNH